MTFIIEAIGYAGTGLVFIWYYLISHGRISGEAISGQLLSLSNAALLGVNYYAHGTKPGMLLEIVWAIIAFAAIARVLWKRRRATPKPLTFHFCPHGHEDWDDCPVCSH